MIFRITYLSVIFCLAACMSRQKTDNQAPPETPFLVVLGIAQDAGYPQSGCEKACCRRAWENPGLARKVVSLALADPAAQQWWLLEATPDFREQLHDFQEITQHKYPFLPAGIFLTHGHIGHYTGLQQLGREVMNALSVPVYALPRMDTFLRTNGPWSQLVQLQNIEIRPMAPDQAEKLSPALSIQPFLVPHRDEYTETAGFEISADNYKVLFIPDIDKWERFDRDIQAMVQQSDMALLDATFYADGELPGRPMSEIPHPFIAESMALLDTLPETERQKVTFIHFNHTNPVLDRESDAYAEVIRKGYRVAEERTINMLMR